MKLRFHRPRRRPLVAYLLLVAVLLFAQSAAYAHLYSHFGASSERSDQSGTATQLCSQCLAGAPLLGAAGAPSAPLVVQVHCEVAHITWICASPIESRRYYAFRSRAPPLPLA